MIPTVNENHTQEAMQLLTDMFKNKLVVTGLLKSWIDQLQEIEDETWTYLEGIILANAVGDVLDKYGAILKVKRGGYGDDEYRMALRIKIKVLRSNGLAEDIIQCAALIFASFIYAEWPPAAWTLFTLNVQTPFVVLNLLGKIRMAGTRGVFLFSTWAPGTEIVFGSTIGTVSTARGFKDALSGQFPNSMISSQDLK